MSRELRLVLDLVMLGLVSAGVLTGSRACWVLVILLFIVLLGVEWRNGSG